MEPETAIDGIVSTEQMEFVQELSPVGGHLRSEQQPEKLHEIPDSDGFFLQSSNQDKIEQFLKSPGSEMHANSQISNTKLEELESLQNK